MKSTCFIVERKHNVFFLNLFKELQLASDQAEESEPPWQLLGHIVHRTSSASSRYKSTSALDVLSTNHEKDKTHNTINHKNVIEFHQNTLTEQTIEFMRSGSATNDPSFNLHQPLGTRSY